ncbi:MAG: YqaA family protein [Candidatus Latescibacterota bacterium]
MEYVDQLIRLLRELGVLGLLGLAFIDSAGIPTGGGPDWVIVVLLSQEQTLVDFLMTVPLAVLGSTVGCLGPYYLGRRGGDVVLRRFDEKSIERVRDKIDRYGFWAMTFSVIAPPPYPMKLFIVSAGVFGMPVIKFAGAVFLGRSLRYSVVGYLAVCYGEQASQLMRDHFLVIASALAAIVACAIAVQSLRRRKA